MITFEDFMKIDMRAGEILEVKILQKARVPTYTLKIDFGELGIKKSSAQAANYKKEEMIGRKIIGVVNLPPKQIANFMSEVLVLGVPGEDGKVVLLQPDKHVKNGKKVY